MRRWLSQTYLDLFASELISKKATSLFKIYDVLGCTTNNSNGISHERKTNISHFSNTNIFECNIIRPCLWAAYLLLRLQTLCSVLPD